MSRLKNRIVALERRKAPGSWVYALSFAVEGMSREEIIAEEAQRRHAKGDSRPFTLAPHFAVVPEVAKASEQWLARYAPGGTEWARWGK